MDMLQWASESMLQLKIKVKGYFIDKAIHILSGKLHNLLCLMNWPFSQFLPLNPWTHKQLWEFTPSVQVPRFWHGFGEQSSMSVELMNVTLVEIEL